MAEEERFELSVLVSKYGHLANAWFQPLTHSSKFLYLIDLNKDRINMKKFNHSIFNYFYDYLLLLKVLVHCVQLKKDHCQKIGYNKT